VRLGTVRCWIRKIVCDIYFSFNCDNLAAAFRNKIKLHKSVNKACCPLLNEIERFPVLISLCQIFLREIMQNRRSTMFLPLIFVLSFVHAETETKFSFLFSSFRVIHVATCYRVFDARKIESLSIGKRIKNLSGRIRCDS
jgi:hypothetical protein